MPRSLLERAATSLAAGSRAYTRRNLFHAWRRLGGRGTFEEFEEGPLAKRLARGPLEGLLAPSMRWDGPALPEEYAAYFPRSILVVDRAPILDLFIASGVMTTARLAVVCIDGSPANVVAWLARGFRLGHRAPVGYLHDAATAFYPFAVEPLASLVACAGGEPIDIVDLGLPPRGALRRRFPFRKQLDANVGARARLTELEELPPCAMAAYAARQLMARVPGDPQMAPLVRPREERART